MVLKKDFTTPYNKGGVKSFSLKIWKNCYDIAQHPSKKDRHQKSTVPDYYRNEYLRKTTTK